jgi:outer membrane receptor protein involved in Fe transport
MTRSRFIDGHSRYREGSVGGDVRPRRLPLASAISAILVSGAPLAHAADSPPSPPAESDVGTLQEVVVTAQKVSENLQNVPISIEVLDNTKLEELHVVSLDDYVKFSPSISYSRAEGQGGNGQPGTSHIYMRGVTSGANENHSGSQPTVGTYLDEQPVTTIDGSLDVHLYDIQRIEVLEGPQGTLYGASSEAGTVRIITNKPDPGKFSAGFDVEGNDITHGGQGWKAEGFVNLPLSSIAAVRLVGWDEHDGGYINNVAGTNRSACIVNGVRTFPTWSGAAGGTFYGSNPSAADVAPCVASAPLGAGAISNAAYRSNDYNTVETRGGRAALKFDLGDNWTVTPTMMGQTVSTNGFFGYDPAMGFLNLAHFGPETSNDSFTQEALTVEGKIGNFDLTYAGAYMKRSTHSIADYSDYSEFYDRLYGSGAYWTGANGKPIMGQELVVVKGYFEKWSHEIRLSTPADLPVRGTAGIFVQRQTHDIWEQYVMPGYDFTNPYGTLNSSNPNPNGLDQNLSIPTLGNTIWLTDEVRVDRDQALFAQGTWDVTSQFSLNAGIRYFTYDNTLAGFFGYSENYPFSSGVKGCFGPPTSAFAPCTNLDNRVTGSGNVPRINATYKITPDAMVYATFSKGFRPGGANRTSEKGIGPYQADYLKNYEIGWKTQWFDHRLRWNGDFFWEDWNDFQFSFLGPNSVTIIVNGGDARIKGWENELEWAVTSQFTLSSSFTLLDAKLTQNYCGTQGVTSCPDQVTPEAFQPNLIGPQAPAGTNLPLTPRFKTNLIGRYTFDELAGGWKPFGQLSLVYQSQASQALRVDQNNILGNIPSYALADLALGAAVNNSTVQFTIQNLADRHAQLSRFTAIAPQNDTQVYVIPVQPRTFVLKFGQKF